MLVKMIMFLLCVNLLFPISHAHQNIKLDTNIRLENTDIFDISDIYDYSDITDHYENDQHDGATEMTFLETEENALGNTENILKNIEPDASTGEIVIGDNSLLANFFKFHINSNIFYLSIACFVLLIKILRKFIPQK